MHSSVISIGIKIPPLILGTGGRQQGNFCADVKLSPDLVTTTICLAIAIASKCTSKSPPHLVDCKMKTFFASY